MMRSESWWPDPAIAEIPTWCEVPMFVEGTWKRVMQRDHWFLGMPSSNGHAVAPADVAEGGIDHRANLALREVQSPSYIPAEE